MLGALAKYIFGGMMGEAPETTSPELQYQTREVNDWLLVDMPDQAIDDEDMDSESDDDEILTALPLLMAEEVVQPLQIVQLGEETKDSSVCDNSYDKVQRCYVDKTRSVPSAVQHHSGGKTQGNFVDNIEAVSVEVEDNVSSKIKDISADVQENSNNIIQNEFAAEACDAVQKNCVAAQTVFEVADPCIDLPDDQYISDGEFDPDFRFEDILIKENSFESGRNFIESQDSLKVQKFTNEDILGINFDEVTSTYSEDEGYSDNKVRSHLVVDKVEERYSMTEYLTQDGFFDSIEDNFYAEVGDGKIQDNSEIIQTNLNHREGEFYLENSNHVPVNYNCTQKRLYSQVVQMGRQNQAPADPMKDIFSNEIGRNYDRCVRIFGDEIQESSDDEMNETSDDEMSESPKDEIHQNYDEDENSNDETRGKSYNTVNELFSDEESEEYSEDKPLDNFDYHKRYLQITNRNRVEMYDPKEFIKASFFHMIKDMVLNHGICCVPHTEYEHVVGFRNIPQCWYAYETLQEPILQALLIRNYYMNEPTGQCPNINAFLCKNVTNKKCDSQPFPDDPLHDSSLMINSSPIIQNFLNQKPTIPPPKTGVVVDHIKELKPAQQAMQLENRKYLTRSQLNRQNRNFMYQSSTKSNRRRNLQRNHSGANNNRKC